MPAAAERGGAETGYPSQQPEVDDKVKHVFLFLGNLLDQLFYELLGQWLGSFAGIVLQLAAGRILFRLLLDRR